MVLRSPFPYYGGKSTVADLVWERFGDVPSYVEPCFGSGAMLLARPHWPWDGHRIETVNDACGYICNFWRALQADPEGVAAQADHPVNELDLHARHFWLVNTARAQVERLREDPEFYDVTIAGWWVWGICCWIGSGWCSHPEWQQLPHLGDAGKGVHRPSHKLPHLRGAGKGVHRPSQQLPHLGGAGRDEPDIYPYFRLLAERLRRVRVCCGDWSRLCGPTPTVTQGLTSVFLDPPYAHSERDDNLYAVDQDIAADVRAWCLEHGDDSRLRICLAGYAGEGHEVLEQQGWEVVAWKTRGGYANQSNGRGRDNTVRERLWFSPACLKVDDPLFAGLAL